jgi:hypothetical protein
MKRIPSSETNICSASQEIPRIFGTRRYNTAYRVLSLHFEEMASRNGGQLPIYHHIVSRIITLSPENYYIIFSKKYMNRNHHTEILGFYTQGLFFCNVACSDCDLPSEMFHTNFMMSVEKCIRRRSLRRTNKR